MVGTMTIAKTTSTLPGRIASALLGVAIGASGMAALAAPAPATCHVPANPGTYTCTVTVDAPSPTPSPTVAPTPSPTPSPTPGPTSTPMVGVAVPTTIDATGASDVSSKLATFLNGLPANSTVQFPAGATYSVATAIKLGGRTNLDLEGNGATIRSTAGSSNTNENYSVFYFQTFPGANTGIGIHNFKLVGSDPTPNTFVGGKEGQMGVLVDGGNGFDIAGNTFSGSWGDAVEVNSAATNVRIHNNTILSAGRNALSVIWGNHVEMDHNQITQVGYVTFDVEPNTASEPSSFINIHDNAGGKWSDAFFAVDGSSTGAAIGDLSVVNNTSATGLLAIINPSGKAREPRIVFTGNTGPATSGPVVTAHAVDGLTVTGNTPAKSGSFLSAVSCTAVTGQ